MFPLDIKTKTDKTWIQSNKINVLPLGIKTSWMDGGTKRTDTVSEQHFRC